MRLQKVRFLLQEKFSDIFVRRGRFLCRFDPDQAASPWPAKARNATESADHLWSGLAPNLNLGGEHREATNDPGHGPRRHDVPTNVLVAGFIHARTQRSLWLP